ncbi:MAG: ParA family protein [Bdellovibrionales bacterium]|jgi:chromosome partitioning protein|nr:ParA family protein [Bdellovibrionales bacterium]
MNDASPSQLQYSSKKAHAIFGADPSFSPETSSSARRKSYGTDELLSLGAEIGFLKKPDAPIAAAIFVTKGGVLKTTLTLNLARMAALHGLKVCVVGLDMQGDITQALGGDGPDENQSLAEALKTLNSMRGLADLFNHQGGGPTTLDELILPTEIPSLFYIPETPELVALDQSLLSRNRREYWLLENVVEPLKEKFDLILMDCSPNWNRLINNALVASDVLLSPIESKINNFRNLRTFRALVSEFKRDMRIDFRHLFVPTRVVASRRLSREIFDWYKTNLENCSTRSIRESVQGEEATALRLSIPEHSPNSVAAAEMRILLHEIGTAIGIAKTDDPALLATDLAKLGGSPEKSSDTSSENQEDANEQDHSQTLEA